jgi:A/G-specific adenine glycosylase
MVPPSAEPSPSASAREALLSWYRPRRSAYPWRGAHPDPYAVLVSEVMLQQTQAARVIPAFQAFMTRFPCVEDLAAASRADVLRAWGGLGYPRRAVALHRAAGIIVHEHAGRMPRDPSELRALPGVGEYTAAAIASLAFGQSVAAVDTNVRRIWARVVHGLEADEVSSSTSREDASAWLDPDHPAAWNQALMDLGRDVCRPRPRCEACPLRPWCRFAASGKAGSAGRRPTIRRQAPFEGSMRQVRGSVVALLRERSSATIAAAAASTGHAPARITEAVVGLVNDDVIDASPGALRGSTRGRIKLAGDTAAVH